MLVDCMRHLLISINRSRSRVIRHSHKRSCLVRLNPVQSDLLKLTDFFRIFLNSNLITMEKSSSSKNSSKKIGHKEKANYFVCVRVTNPEVLDNVMDALAWVLDKDAQYTDFCYTREMMHVTLCELCLETEDDVEYASQALAELKQTILDNLPGNELCIKGITTFFNKVMIADVEYEDDFRKFAEVISTGLEGVNVIKKHNFRPHMTIMKVNTAKARKAKVMDINPWLFVNLKNKLFGYQRVNSVHLCKMGYERRQDGFYKTPYEIICRPGE